MDKDQLKRHIQKSDLTAMEKRYLEDLVDMQCKTDGRRLIDADALFKCDTCDHKRNGACTTFCDTVESYRPDMSKLKIIEAEPVRHGYWISVDGGDTCDEWECSVCGKWMVFQYDMDYDDMCENFPRCPKCGARMDGGE